MEELVSINIFSFLLPLMANQTRQVRLLTAAICARIYKNRENAQKMFFKLKGSQDLLQLLIRDGDSDEVLCRLLEHVIDLVLVNDI